jgi:SAM-dependent methyltransferase
MMSSAGIYNKLCTEFYNLEKPWASEQEIVFFAQRIAQRPGLWLEAMCGSGRLLIPLLKLGVTIEGIDNSDYMLESCIERAKAELIAPKLFNQSLTQLNLDKQYNGIIIAYSSFQLIYDQELALRTLQLLNKHLLPGGTLLIECFVPWDLIRDSIKDLVPVCPAGPFLTNRSIKTLDSTLLLTSSITVNTEEQYMTSVSLFEKKDLSNKIVLSEVEEHTIRWYYRYEFIALLEKAGFSIVAIYKNSFHLEAQDVLFEAVKL